jgi:hypothetical protein
MEPKEKAKELVEKYADLQTNIDWTDSNELLKTCEINNSFYENEFDIYWNLLAKESALIAVDEIIKECEKFFEAISENRKLYWQEVKQEIEKL